MLIAKYITYCTMCMVLVFFTHKDLFTEFPAAVCYDRTCTDSIVNHIQEEFNAAFKYLYMVCIKHGRPTYTDF